jgi:signal transduction histidine kinase
VARLAINISKVIKNIKKAAVRLYIYIVLLVMLFIVLVGTILTLRISFKQVTAQYELNIQRSLQRIEYEIDSLDGRIILANIGIKAPDSRGIPFFDIPLEYMSVIPGHVGDIKPLLGCSYSSPAGNKASACAGVLRNKLLGSVAYIRGTFSSATDLVSPEKVEVPTSGHHFLITIYARNKEEKYIVILDPIQRTTNPQLPYLSPAWSLTGFKIEQSSLRKYSRDPQIKGRVLKTSLDKNSFQYEFIFQIPMVAFSNDVVLANQDHNFHSWPPNDLKEARLGLRLMAPKITNLEDPLLDSSSFQSESNFSFSQMQNYILPNERIMFSTPKGDQIAFTRNTENHTDSNSGYILKLINSWADILIKATVPSSDITRTVNLSDGSIISIKGDASSVLSGWKEAARSSIAFSFVLMLLLFVALFILRGRVLSPLYRVRRNTLHLKERLIDGEDIKLPFSIKESDDEFGVLWGSILELYKSLISFRKTTIERTKAERNLLKAIGHEIRSPLQNLLLRHNDSDDLDKKDLKRMSFAIKNLFDPYVGDDESTKDFIAMPQDIFSATAGGISTEDVSEFLRNAADSSVRNVSFIGKNESLTVLANGDMLESVLTAIINNADDFRDEGSYIYLDAYAEEDYVVIVIRNEGPGIPSDFIDDIFVYGVSTRNNADQNEHLGQGLNLAMSYVNNMNGTIVARNVDGGVEFEIRLIKAT